MHVKNIRTNEVIEVPWEHGVYLLRNKSKAFIEVIRSTKKETKKNSNKESK